jgi:hypothetical protein
MTVLTCGCPPDPCAVDYSSLFAPRFLQPPHQLSGYYWDAILVPCAADMGRTTAAEPETCSELRLNEQCVSDV